MMLTPEQRPTLTINNDGKVLTETIEGIELPADYSFATINDYVHDVGRQYEELQCLALCMANHINAQQALITELEQDASRYRWLRDSTECESLGDFLNIDFEKMDSAIDAAMQK